MSKIGKSLLIAAVAVFMFGCGGEGLSSGDNGNGNGGDTGVSRSYPSFNLPTNGVVQVTYLTGTNRGVGSQVAVFDDIELQNGTDDRIPQSNDTQLGELKVVLDEYKAYSVYIPVRFDNVSVSSREFTEYPFRVKKLQEILGDGTSADLPAASDPAVEALAPFDVQVTTIPGRYTAIQMLLNDNMLSYSDADGITFDEDQFTAANYDPRVNALRGFFSDFLAFDVSGLSGAQRPNMSTGSSADTVYFSGDAIAVSRGSDSNSTFELLDPVAIKSGVIATGPNIGGDKANNTYTLFDRDPSDVQQAALTGVWKDFKSVVTPNGDLVAIALPSASDTSVFQMVVYTVGADGRVSALWEGRIDMTLDGSDSTGTFSLWPVNTIDDAVPNNTEKVSGKISGAVLKNGALMKANWDVTSSTATWPFATGGGLSVYRG